jgi:nucleotide-binding universal stress UspA family protein
MRRWLVPHDLSPASDEAADLAADELELFGGGIIYLAHVAAEDENVDPEAPAIFHLDHLGRLERRLMRSRVRVEALRLSGTPCDTLMTVVDDERIDRIVLAQSSRSNVSRFFLGSVSDDIVHHSPVPVLVVKTAFCPTALTVEPFSGDMAIGAA